MPRNGSGTFTLVSGNPVVTGTTIESNWANTTLSDIATAMTDSLSRSGQGGMTAALRIADGTQGAPGVGFANETGSGFYRAGTGEVWAVVQGAQTMRIDSTGVTVPAAKATSIEGTFVFNETGADKDARFEGDTDANLLFTDASTDRVGVGTATPAAKLDVNGTAAISGNVTLSGGTANGVLYLNGSKVATSGSGLEFDGSNLGLGVTPSAWGTLKAMQFPVGSIAGYDGGTGNRQINFINNAYFDGSVYKYVVTDTAQRYTLINGQHQWLTAPSGTAGNTISFGDAKMTLDASGNFLVGTTTAIGRATVVGGSSQLALHDGNGSNTNYGLLNYGGTSGELTLNANSTSGNTLIRFLTSNGGSNAERARITSAGDFIHQVNGTAPSLSSNSTMSFELTSNTSLKIVVRGTDGVTRSVSLTLT